MLKNEPARKWPGKSLRRWRRCRCRWHGRRCNWLLSLRLSCFHRTGSRATRGTAGERQQGDVTGALDSDTEPTLVTRKRQSCGAEEFCRAPARIAKECRHACSRSNPFSRHKTCRLSFCEKIAACRGEARLDHRPGRLVHHLHGVHHHQDRLRDVHHHPRDHRGRHVRLVRHHLVRWDAVKERTLLVGLLVFDSVRLP